jgi:hypothetical protein
MLGQLIFAVNKKEGKKFKNQKPKRLMSFSRLIQWYHSHVDPIWPDGTFKHWQDDQHEIHPL